MGEAKWSLTSLFSASLDERSTLTSFKGIRSLVPPVIYPFDFSRALLRGNHTVADKRVMARVALNALVDPLQFPVDLSEISKLKNEARLLTRAFLAYMATNPTEYGTGNAFSCEGFYQVLAADETRGNIHPAAVEDSHARG